MAEGKGEVMKLISCERCGAVLDTGRIAEPYVYNRDTWEVIRNVSRYNNESHEFEPIIECPACETSIFYRSGDSAPPS